MGLDPWKVPLASYLFKPNTSYTLRAIANGRFTILEAARNLDEHYFISCILKKVREQNSNVRLSALAKQVAKEKNIDLKDKQSKKVVWQQVAVEVTDTLAQMQVNTSSVEMSELLKRLDSLTTQLGHVAAENEK